MYSRFTLYARRTMLVANATALHAGKMRVDTKSMAAALLSEPDGLAARIIADLGISKESMHAALGTSEQTCDIEPTVANLEGLNLGDDATAALESTCTATLRLGTTTSAPSISCWASCPLTARPQTRSERLG